MGDVLNAILELVQNSNRKSRCKDPECLTRCSGSWQWDMFQLAGGSNWCYIQVTTVRCPKGRYPFLRGFSYFIYSIHLPLVGFKPDSLLNVLAPIPQRESWWHQNKFRSHITEHKPRATPAGPSVQLPQLQRLSTFAPVSFCLLHRHG